jgi:hypothetical protein
MPSRSIAGRFFVFDSGLVRAETSWRPAESDCGELIHVLLTIPA